MESNKPNKKPKAQNRASSYYAVIQHDNKFYALISTEMLLVLQHMAMHYKENCDMAVLGEVITKKWGYNDGEVLFGDVLYGREFRFRPMPFYEGQTPNKLKSLFKRFERFRSSTVEHIL